jgi:phosphoribosyl-dephospho-CoA transferase
MQMAQIEEKHPAGRFFGIDVLRPDGGKISRQMVVGLPPQICFLCGEDTRICRRNQSHPAEELLTKVREITAVSYIADAAEYALATELEAHPKPGFVDPYDPGRTGIFPL